MCPPSTSSAQQQQHGFLSGGGDMARLIVEYNWAKSVIGPIDTWPQVLKDTLSLILRTQLPMFLWWGEHLIQFYNDAFRPSLGADGKHPLALGQRGEECWQEIWPVIYPMIEQVWNGGLSTWHENQLMPIYRNGRLEDVYWTFSYSLVGNDPEQKGILVVGTETTGQVQAYSTVSTAKDDLDFAIHAAELGTWDLDPKTNRFVGNERLKEWFGLDADREIELERAIAVIAEEDRTKVITAMAMAMIYEAGGLYDIDYTIIHPVTGIPRYVRAKGKAIFDENRQPVRFSGTLEDITNEEFTVGALEEAYEQVRLSKEAAGLGMFDMDLIKGTLIWDERCRELFGIFHEGSISYDNDFTKGLHPEDRDRITQIINELLLPGSDGNYDVEYRTVGAEDSKLRWVRAKGKVFFNRNDKPYRFIGSVLDITESKLDEVRKNDFIGMVSHELKTPLTTLSAILQVLQLKLKQSDNFTSEALAKAIKQSKKMASLINGFLNISRLESGKIVLYKEKFDLNDLVTEMIHENEVMNTTHHIHFIADKGIIVNADREKIGSVISNLLSNAIKYSEKGTSIYVSCEVAENSIVLSVKDEGVGISLQDQEKLFDRYYRVQNNQTRHISGFGIGLYLSAEIIRRHEGSIWVESELGKGSTFYFSLLTEN
jgi:PAS domain-containing protein/two-component sensor histidine kinase